MAGPRKKPAVEKSGDNEESMELDQEIVADFEGRNPEAIDFSGIKNLLNQLFLKAHVNISQLSDMIIAQQGLGTVLRQVLDDGNEEDSDDDDDDESFVLGVTSVINMTEHKDKDCIKQILGVLEELAKKHADKPVQDKCSSILDLNKNKVGLLINERFINIPAKCANPLMTSLVGEVDKKGKKNPAYNFDYFLMICKTHMEKKNKKMVEFANAEEEVFFKSSELSFEFSVETDSSVSGTWTEDDIVMLPMRRVLLINAKKLSAIVDAVVQFVA